MAKLDSMTRGRGVYIYTEETERGVGAVRHLVSRRDRLGGIGFGSSLLSHFPDGRGKLVVCDRFPIFDRMRIVMLIRLAIGSRRRQGSLPAVVSAFFAESPCSSSSIAVGYHDYRGDRVSFLSAACPGRSCGAFFHWQRSAGLVEETKSTGIDPVFLTI